METVAVRLYGANDLRLERFELPEMAEDEVLLRVMTDSLCASSYKMILQGSAHKRVPPNVAEQPIIIGHELCGEIVEVGAALRGSWRVGQRVVIQPALKLESGYDVGYSYPYVGGDTMYAVVPRIVMERGCLLPFEGDSFYKGSLVEPIGCVLRAFKGMYHTDYTDYSRTDGARRGGKLAILGGAGPMGMAAVELAIGYAGCSQVVVTDLSAERLAHAESRCTPEAARAKGCELIYVNTAGDEEEQIKRLLEISDGGFDDVMVMVAVGSLLSMAERIAKTDGCINLFAGPAVHDLQGSLNLYRVHYDGIHVVGTAGSIPEDTLDVIDLIERGVINPSVMVSDILCLGGVIDAFASMAKAGGAKKVCYNALDIPSFALADLPRLALQGGLWAGLDEIVTRHGGLWSPEAEAYLLANAPRRA